MHAQVPVQREGRQRVGTAVVASGLLSMAPMSYCSWLEICTCAAQSSWHDAGVCRVVGFSIPPSLSDGGGSIHQATCTPVSYSHPAVLLTWPSTSARPREQTLGRGHT